MGDKIRRFLAAPIFDDEDKTRNAALINPVLLSMFGVLFLTAMATIFLFAEKLGSGIAVGVIFITLLAAKIFLERGQVRLAGILLVIGIWVPSNAVFVLSGHRSMTGAANVSLIVIAGLVLGRGGAFTVAVVSSLLFLIGVVMDALGMPFPDVFPAPLAASWVMLTISLVMAVVPLNMALRRLRESLARSRQYATDLESQQEEMQALAASQEQELERRSSYLGAATAIAEEAARVGRDPQVVLDQVVHVISDQFGFYHTGIFLLDAFGEWAVLEAASSKGGQQMLERGHRLRVGGMGVGQGIVGDVAIQGRYRIAVDVGEDAAFFDNPDLPETRSEIALPLKVRDEIIGILDVQSVKENAFSADDVLVLQTLADQIAIAISNAQLFSQVEASLEAERQAYGELTRAAWQDLLEARSDLAFASGERGVFSFQTWEPQMKEAMRTGERVVSSEDNEDEAAQVLALPIRVRDEVVGVIDGRKPGDVGWTEGEIDLLETLTEQLGMALESARLYQDSQQRAAREQIVSEITGRMRETLDLETVLKTAADEMRQALELPEVSVRLMQLDE